VKFIFIPSPTKLRYYISNATVKIWPLDLWPWKSIGFQTPLRTKYVPSLVKIHWMMLILVFTRMDFQGQRSRSQGQIFRQEDTPCFVLPLFSLIFPFAACCRDESFPLNSIFPLFFLEQNIWSKLLWHCIRGILLFTYGVSSCLKIWPCDLDLWPWKSIGFQILLRTMYVPSLVKIHWKMLILECSQGCYAHSDTT
jgi:hypothetical protein